MGALAGVGTAVEVTLDLLEGAIDRLLQLGEGDLEPESMRAYVRRTRVAINRLEFVSGRALVAFDACGGPATVGEPSSVSWLKNECRLDPGAAAERVVVARQMEIRPDSAMQFSQGRIGYDDAAVIARSVVEVREEDGPVVERRVLALAAGMDPGRLRHAAKQVVAEVDNEALLRDSRRAYQRRALRIGPDRNGNVKVEATLTSECAAYLRVAVNAHMGPAGKDDDRTTVQRRHDSLEAVLRNRGALPTVAGERPHITVVAPLSAMLGEDGPPALLQGLVPISGETLARIACEASLSAVIEDDKGRPIYSTRSDLLAPTAACPRRPRDDLQLAQLRPACRVVRRPPPGGLRRRRPDHARQRGVGVLVSPSAPARGRLGAAARPRPDVAGNPARGPR